MKWIYGEANCDDWVPSVDNVNTGTGKFGTCCAEFDVWEANMYAQAFTSHPCDIDGSYRYVRTYILYISIQGDSSIVFT